MKKISFALIAALALVLSSCQHNNAPAGEVAATLNLSASKNSVWRQNAPQAETTTKDIYYVLDANGLLQTAVRANHGEAANAEKLLAFGDYSVFCITNADPSGIPYTSSMLGTDITDDAFVLNTLTDISFGQQSLTILASQTNYDINVTVSHILAQLSLTIASVPADIESIAVTLTNVSKTFYLDGTFATDGTTQLLYLQSATSPNADGTYDWTLPESLIYPCPTGATATDLSIVATDTNGNATTYTSSSSTVCSSGSRTNLATIWHTLVDHLSYGYTETPWTTTVQQGTFDL